MSVAPRKPTADDLRRSTVESAEWTVGEFVPSDACVDAIASLLLDLAEAEAAEPGEIPETQCA